MFLMLNYSSSVGPSFAKTRGTIFAVVGFLLLAAGAGVTVGTLELAKQSSGGYLFTSLEYTM